VHIDGRDEASTLRAVISTVFSTLELDAVLAGVVDIATEATGCHACLIYLVEGDRLVLRAASPVHRASVGRIAMGFDEGVTGWVARHAEPALIGEHALRDPRMRYFPELEEERWQSMVAVPVCARTGEVIGVIILHTAAPHEFGEEVVGLLGHVATLVGGAIEDAQLYEEARERVRALTRLAEVSGRLAAATEHERIHAAATTGARSLLGARLCQLFRLDEGGRELALIASDPPGAAGPRPHGGGALLLELLSRGRPGAAGRDLWPEHDGAALLSAPLVASGEQLGLLCVLGPRRAGEGEQELLRALADQTAMGLQRAELIARLTARERVGDLLAALQDGAPEATVLRAAPAGCDLTRAHVLICAGPGPDAGRPADWEAVAARLGARLRGRDRAGFLHAAADGLRGVVVLPKAGAAERVTAICDAVGAAAHVVLGVSAVACGVAESRQALREADRAARIARTLRAGGGAVGFEALGAYKYLADETPRDPHWTAVQALAAHDGRRRTALLATLEAYLARRRSVADTARALFIHPNTLRQRLARVERVTGLRLADEDLLALELAVKLARLA